MRITRLMQTRNLLAELSRGTARLARYQEQIASGRKLLRASDDPGATARSIDGRARVARIDSIRENIGRGLSTLGTIDATLAEVNDLITQAKEIALQSANAPVTSEDREAAATQIDSIIARARELANTYDGERYLFGGQETLSAPFAEVDGAITYRGDGARAVGRVDLTESVPLLLPGSDAFAVSGATLGGDADLDPDIWEFTRLDDLNGGLGAVLSQISITDSNGATAAVNLVGAETVKDVLDRINGAGLAVTAALNADGNGIALANTGAGTTITIAEVGDGIAAQQLGILGAFTGDAIGTDLDAAVSENTPLALLRSGQGIAPGALVVSHEIDGEVVSGEIDFSFARTVGDLFVGLARAENTGGTSLRVSGSISASGDSIVVRSTAANSRLSIENAAGSTLASELGVAGSARPLTFFGVLESLRDSLRGDDQDGIETAVADLDGALSNNLLARVDVGSRVARTEAVRESLGARRILEEEHLSNVQDVDLAEAVVKASQEQVAYQAALQATSRAISVSLLDFLR